MKTLKQFLLEGGRGVVRETTKKFESNHEGGKVKSYIVTSPQAAKARSSRTMWCTKKTDTCNQYLQGGKTPLHIIHYTDNNGVTKKFQFSMNTDELSDEENNSVENLPEEIVEHLAQNHFKHKSFGHMNRKINNPIIEEQQNQQVRELRKHGKDGPEHVFNKYGGELHDLTQHELVARHPEYLEKIVKETGRNLYHGIQRDIVEKHPHLVSTMIEHVGGNMPNHVQLSILENHPQHIPKVLRHVGENTHNVIQNHVINELPHLIPEMLKHVGDGIEPSLRGKIERRYSNKT